MNDMILIRNKSTYKNTKGYKEILIDRTTTFGNPFRVEDWGRRSSIQRYAESMKGALDNPKIKTETKLKLQYLENEMLKAIQRNEPIVLLCHCYPKKCHGEVLKQMLLNKYHKNYWLVKDVCEHCKRWDYIIGVYGQ